MKQLRRRVEHRLGQRRVVGRCTVVGGNHLSAPGSRLLAGTVRTEADPTVRARGAAGHHDNEVAV